MNISFYIIYSFNENIYFLRAILTNHSTFDTNSTSNIRINIFSNFLFFYIGNTERKKKKKSKRNRNFIFLHTRTNRIAFFFKRPPPYIALRFSHDHMSLLNNFSRFKFDSLMNTPVAPKNYN